MKMMKRALALLLCIVMVVGLVPATVFAADGGGISAQANDGPIYVLAGGDFQQAGDHAGSAENVRNILAQISQKYQTMDGMLFVGDYDCETHNSATETANGITALMGAVQGKYSNLNDANSVLAQGNHDYMDSRIDKTGGHDFDGYSAYVLNEDDYPNGGGSQSDMQTLANNLKTWLNNKIGEGYTAPIFIVSHLPLAYTPRTVTQGDAKYAKYIFDVLNDAGKNGLNIIFLHGHDHAYGPDNYMGGEAIYLPVGDKICIAEAGSTSAWTEETLNFTYMNAGYTGYYSDAFTYVTTAGTDKLTMTVFAITDNQVTVERYSEDGLYNLKSAGHDGSYSNTSVTNVSLGLPKYSAVYASPQTITLMDNGAADMGTIGEWVGIASQNPADDVTTSNKGWVELIAPVAGTPAVPGTPESTKYVYTLDTDGTVTDKANAEQGYLIVGSNNNYAMTDSLGRTGVTITNNAITLDAQPDYEWWITADGKITDGTNYLKLSVSGGGWFDSPTASFAITQNEGEATTWSITHSGSGSYQISYSYSYSGFMGRPQNVTYYLHYNSNAFNVTSSSNTVRLFSGAKVVTPATDGTPAVPGTNGVWYKIVDNKSDNDFSYDILVGASAQRALDAVYDGVTVYKYEGMTAPTASTTGTAVSDSDVTWTLDSNYSGSTAGDYAITITKDNKTLGTAEVVVPAQTTYYIAEGNGLYLVDMNTTADNAMATVKAGITVYAADDTNGANKTLVPDNNVTWNWVDKYNGADSGPYTVEILYDGASLGTVEVKVDVKYETGIKTDWTPVGTTESTGGSYTYTLDTDGIDYGEEHKYIIVDDNEAIVLNASSASDGTAHSITISGNTATLNTRDYEYHFIQTSWYDSDQRATERYELITKGNGSQYLYQESNGVRYGTRSSVKFQVNHHGNGIYDIHDEDGTEWYIIYSGGWTVTKTTSARVRLYKYTGTTGGTPGGPIYALIEGKTVYTVDQGTSATKALAAVKAGITGYLAPDANGTGKTEIKDSDLTWTWKNTFNGNFNGSYWVEISYKGKVLGTVEVKVEPGTVNNYPEYPDEGAVKVNKTGTGIQFQSTGVAQVELSASGVPSKKGVDVIIMLDTSSSMTKYDVTGTTTKRAAVMEQSLKDLINTLKTRGDDNEMLDIQVAIADFNGFNGYGGTSGTPYDRDEADHMNDTAMYTANGNNAQIFTGDRSLKEGAFVSVEDLTFEGLQVDNPTTGYKFRYDSGTNYDYAMDAIYQLATAKKLANGSEERDLYVIFMSDGAAMQWNYYHSQGASSLWNNWITGAWDADDLTSTNLNCTTHKYYYNLTDTNGDGMLNEHWMANAIKGDPTQVYKVIRKTATLGTAVEGEANMYMVAGLGAKLFTISFDAQADDRVTEESMDKSIEALASAQTGSTKYYYKVTSATELTNAFKVIGTEIAYAANNARFVDQMGDNFNLQMTPIVDYAGNAIKDGKGNAMLPSIEIISYDIWTRADYEANKCTIDQIGVRKGTYTILETVTFTSVKNTDGSYTVTGAYSDQINDGKTNILADGTQTGYVKGVIYAKTFIYNTNVQDVAVDGVNIPTGTKNDGTTTGSTNVLPKETFYWKMGTVQTSELAMRYYVYLDGSMEGTRLAGSYATNNYAILYYDNYLGNSCLKETVSPVMAWKSANVSYAFYLVNEKGEIIVNQTTGKTGTFANKIAVTNPVVYEEILLNNTQQVQSINVAAISDDVLPKYYNLYDEGAVYEIHINSDATGNWAITKGDVTTASTYVTNYTLGTSYSNALTENNSAYDYTHTVVWFAVVWTVEAHPDSVVVDYGLPVDISVLGNDMFGDYGKLAGVGAYSDSLNLDGRDPTLATGFSSTYEGTYGTAKADITTGKVRYTLNTMSMNGYEKFAYAVQYTGSENAGYYYDTVTVIPATTIYYEDNFVNLESYTWNSGWQKVDKGNEKWVWSQEGTVVDATQSEDRPGIYSLTDANNIYGYDSVNKSMGTYSMGAAMKAGVDYDNYGLASFTFYGTGFDIISMTNNTTGTIYVDVYQGDNLVEGKSFIVDTYYGYHQVSGDANGDGTIEDGELVWAVNPDATDSIYQVPVMKVDGLPYGKYTAKITVFYSPVYDNVDGSTGYDFYLDAIRIYDPANDGAADTDNVIENAYKADGEGWPSYIELRNMLIDPNGDGNTDDGAFGNADTSTEVEGVVFIDGDASVGEAQLTDYINYGPNNEVYLAPGQRVAFMLNTPDNVDRIHIGLKSADGAKVTYTITNIAQSSGVTADQWYNARTYTLDTTTDMYYDMTDWKKDIIVISNTGDRYNTNGILSITNIKSTYISNPNGTNTPNEVNTVDLANETTVYMTASAAMLTLRAVNTMDLPETLEPEQSEVSGDRNHDQKDEKTWFATFDAEEIGERITEQAENLCATVKRSKRMKADGTYDEPKMGEYLVHIDPVVETVTVEAKKNPEQIAKDVLKGLPGGFFG